jgi:hypothetical protein
MIKILIAILLNQSLLFSQSLDLKLEKSVGGIEAKPKYELSDSIYLHSIDRDNKLKSDDYRIAVLITNTSDKKMTGIILRYDIKLNIKKDDNTYRTVSLYSSSLRVSEIKSHRSRKVYIYDIKNVFPEIQRFLNAGYTPFEVVIDIMKEPKKGEDYVFYSIPFAVNFK